MERKQNTKQYGDPGMVPALLLCEIRTFPLYNIIFTLLERTEELFCMENILFFE
jgi:hypothetical protein